ncbi:MAG: ribonuclease HII [Rhodospirillales bacterium]|nr:ribonuclease HII [Alphaproteobacteria bacterium]MBL6948084.1 ribonuclease HII [Rhodospirillales bacterium]
MPDFSLEDAALSRGKTVICGIDEAGRGPWAGPVVAGAVILDRASLPGDLIRDLDDSKKLKPARREDLFQRLGPHARIGVGQAGVDEIDEVNILQATFLAMARAVEDLGSSGSGSDDVPDLALVDGNREPGLPCPSECVVKGDAISLSIAAASIVAKVTRDRIMAGLALAHPAYGWERNAGYGTKLHQDALAAHGVTAEHRKSYAPIKKFLGL